MAKKGKMKISKVKRNNQTTNKMKKQGKLKLQRHRATIQKQKQPQQQQAQVEYSSESEASADEWADMLDDEERQYILKRIAKQPQLLSNIPAEEKPNKSAKKRKREQKERMKRPAREHSDSGAESDGSEGDDSGSDGSDGFENKYEKEMAERPAKKLRTLLPIKTKEGLVEQAEEIEESEDEDSVIEEEPGPSQKSDDDDDGEDSADSGMEGTGEEADGEGEVVTAVELLAARRKRLQHEKLRIGALCSSLLESPEKKLKNLYPILYLMDERLKDGTLGLHSVRKIATISACEVFRDILPEYPIRHQDYSNVKLKKDTLVLYKYEKELLEFYKRYLQRLEKAATVLRRKKGDSRRPDESAVSLALVSLQCMCSLLESKPQFNYATNIAQSVVPFADAAEPKARRMVTECCVQVFADDKKGEITLTIVRLINQLVKRRGERLHPSALDCLLQLKIRDVDLDSEADLKLKKKQEEKHKKRIVNLSKKEKKRSKKLKEVERELLETEAQESELSRKKLLTEVTKTVFHIYFRLLKNAPHSKLLCAVLDGLAKFTHVINMDYYTDLVAHLSRLARDDSLRARERLRCVRAALAVLGGAGDAFNVDPAGFHRHLYEGALAVHAGSSLTEAPLIIESVGLICARARRVSAAALVAFAKRMCTLALQLPHNGALACMVLVHQMVQHSKPVSSLLEPDPDSGCGRFDPESPSPEHCGATAAAAREPCVLRRHYHPTVREVATALLALKPLPGLGRMTPLQALEQYDGSKMAFKPPVPPPKRDPPKPKSHGHGPHAWAQPTLKEYCETIESNVEMVINNQR